MSSRSSSATMIIQACPTERGPLRAYAWRRCRNSVYNIAQPMCTSYNMVYTSQYFAAGPK